MKKHSRKSLFVLFCIVFLDMLGVGIVIPILAPLFLDTTGGIFSSPVPYTVRTVLFGLLIASYPFAQFFGAPLLGGLSDRHGRKKLLITSLAGTCIGYAIFALGIALHDIYLLFFSRMLSGFTGGNISVALSSIADVSSPKEKAHNFGLIGMAFGLGFIIGPYVGGKLADSTLVSWFTYATPFWFAAVLSFLNIFAVMFLFRETLRHKSNVPISLLTGFHNIHKAFSLANLRVLFFVVFLISFGFTFFTQFFPVFLIERFHFTQSDIGDLYAYVGVWIALTQGVLVRYLSKRFSSRQILAFSIFFLACIFPLIVYSPSPMFLFFVLPLLAIANGLTHPHTTALVSHLSDQKSQGEILGINQSIISLSQALPPVIAGLVVSLHPSMPLFVASIFIFLAWLVFVLFFRGDGHRFHEVA
jgi:DHA1 family tetracycline resistance protein-like MFS transporter